MTGNTLIYTLELLLYVFTYYAKQYVLTYYVKIFEHINCNFKTKNTEKIQLAVYTYQLDLHVRLL